MKISIKGREIELKETYRAHLIYEDRMKESFRIEKNDDKIITKYVNFFYAVILGCDKTIDLTFDEFQDWLDSDMDLLANFIEWYWDKLLQNYDIERPNEEDGTDKKKLN